MNWLEEIQSLKLPPLERGQHIDPSHGLCAMEMVAFIERLPHSDKPSCTCPVITSVVQILNDYAFTDQNRHNLMAILPELVGTVGSEEQTVARIERVGEEILTLLEYETFDVAIRDLEETGFIFISDGVLKDRLRSTCLSREKYFLACNGSVFSVQSCPEFPGRSCWLDAWRLATNDAFFAVVTRRWKSERRAAWAISFIKELIALGPSSGWTGNYKERVKDLEAFA